MTTDEIINSLKQPTTYLHSCRRCVKRLYIYILKMLKLLKLNTLPIQIIAYGIASIYLNIYYAFAHLTYQKFHLRYAKNAH